jgi:hypothetical protein|tara:strand:- start:1444 stop:1632 length:189 start_codon:yes stop_codon:yes gene_type:complete
MIIKNLSENSDGSCDFDFKVDKQETEFLLSFAIKALMREGIIKTGDEEFAETEVDLPLETMQ